VDATQGASRPVLDLLGEGEGSVELNRNVLQVSSDDTSHNGVGLVRDQEGVSRLEIVEGVIH